MLLLRPRATSPPDRLSRALRQRVSRFQVGEVLLQVTLIICTVPECVRSSSWGS